MQKHTVILRNEKTSEWLLFDDLKQIVTANSLQQVIPVLNEVEHLVNTNSWYAAGCISYEAASAFDPSLRTHQSDDFPLVWFGLFAAPQKLQSLSLAEGSYSLTKWIPDITFDDYRNAIAKIRSYIAQGKTYQVNFTFRMQSQFSGNPEALFMDMINAQSAGYSAYMDIGSHIICSASPELFFQLEDNHIICKPMKGTVKRGRTLDEDHEQALWLQASEKNRAENVMIVDMMRNDLGRIAKVGSVKVPSLFQVEQYRTLWQMTSTVHAEVEKSFVEITKGLFPCASITGAPKISTMNIIHELETSPRNIYTGAIGYLAPHRQAQFNVAIRTVTIDQKTKRASYGAGGGVVWDSTAEDEFQEALLKAQVITRKHPIFNLFETLRWTPQDGYYLLERHLMRLRDSAEYFRFFFDLEAVSAYLHKLPESFSLNPQRVHLNLFPDGRLTHETSLLDLSPKIFRAGLASDAISSQDVYLFHKTTYRSIYEQAVDASSYNDVLFFNERNELTEFSIGNLVLEIDGGLYTPPVYCGILPGTFRAELLERGDIKERVLQVDDLGRCTQIFLVNSVRGWVKIELMI